MTSGKSLFTVFIGGLQLVNAVTREVHLPRTHLFTDYSNSSVNRVVAGVRSLESIFPAFSKELSIGRLRGTNPEDIQSSQTSVVASYFGTILSFAISASIVSVIAHFYHEYKPPRKFDHKCADPDFKKWSSSVFDCFGDMDLFLWSFVCPGIRWSESMSMVGILTFWVAFGICLVLSFLNSLTFGLACWLIGVPVFTFCRTKFRGRFGMDVGLATVLEDCTLYCCCCCCCAISQEARHVEQASLAGKLPKETPNEELTEDV